MAEVKRHPYLNCLCRSDGAVFVYGPPQNERKRRERKRRQADANCLMES